MKTRWHSILLLLGFAATGAGCALPGALLPALIASSHWSDNLAGTVLLVVTATSALAPILIRRLPNIAFGQTLCALGTCLWGMCLFPLVGAGLLGAGLGLTMTGISLSIARQLKNATTALARLNVVWAIGAFCCPPITFHALHTNSTSGILTLAAFAFALLALAGYFTFRKKQPERPQRIPLSFSGVPTLLLIATAMTTGVESSCGGWLATFSQRAHHGIYSVVLAPSLFWAGLFVSRLIASSSWSARRNNVPARQLAALAMLAIAAMLLLASDFVLLGGAFLVGCGLGPLYPALLARILKLKENTGVFILAGIAPAAMTWCVGATSTTFHSLRIGLCVSLAGAITMLVALCNSSEHFSET